MAQPTRVALAQINTTVGDLRGNVERILDFYRRAVEQRATVVLFPELCVAGYPPRDLLHKRRFLDDQLAALNKAAAGIGETPAIVGFVDRNPTRPGKEFFNAAALLRAGKIVGTVRKTLIPTYDVFDEARYFEDGDTVAPVTLDGQRFGVTICEDIWNDKDFWRERLYPRDPVTELVTQGIDAILNISASPYHLGKERIRHDMLRTLALKHGKPVVYCNLVGGNDELIFDGNSMAFDARGNLLAQAKAFEEDMIVVDLDNSRPVSFHAPSQEESLHDSLVLGLRDYCHKCGFRSAVLGLSGGIDSAVTACLAVEALGKGNVIGVSMPSQFSSKGSLDDARVLAQNLGIRYEVIPIQEALATLKGAFKELFKGRKEDTTEENMQARIRGVILMAVSNKFGNLLLTTGNKSELAVGYCTLYGDMCGGLAVISDVPKTMIYRLAEYINKRGGQTENRKLSTENSPHGFPIPLASITKAPSAELRPNQTDQDSLPPYDVLDEILKLYVEEMKSGKEIVKETGYDEKLVRDVIRKVDLNEYKRKQAAPGLRVTSKAFGIGRRVPIAQRYVEHE
jgi:NAD+ synthetase